MSRAADTRPGGENYVPLVWDAAAVEAASTANDQRGKPVALICGRMVSNCSAVWMQECCDRELEARAMLRMDDKETRLLHLAVYADRQAHNARVYCLSQDPAAYGAEARRRLEETVLAIWRQRRARAQAELTTEQA